MTISGLLVTIRYIGLSKASCLTTLRLFHDYFIGEITTIGYDYSRICYDYFSRNATTIAPLLAIGRKPEKRCGSSRQWFRTARHAPAVGLPRRVKGVRQTRRALTADRCQIASRRADLVQMETLTPQQMRRVCTVWHGSITGRTLAPLYTLL